MDIVDSHGRVDVVVDQRWRSEPASRLQLQQSDVRLNPTARVHRIDYNSIECCVATSATLQPRPVSRRCIAPGVPCVFES